MRFRLNYTVLMNIIILSYLYPPTRRYEFIYKNILRQPFAFTQKSMAANVPCFFYAVVPYSFLLLQRRYHTRRVILQIYRGRIKKLTRVFLLSYQQQKHWQYFCTTVAWQYFTFHLLNLLYTSCAAAAVISSASQKACQTPCAPKLRLNSHAAGIIITT